MNQGLFAMYWKGTQFYGRQDTRERNPGWNIMTDGACQMFPCFASNFHFLRTKSIQNFRSRKNRSETDRRNFTGHIAEEISAPCRFTIAHRMYVGVHMYSTPCSCHFPNTTLLFAFKELQNYHSTFNVKLMSNLYLVSLLSVSPPAIGSI